MTLTILITNPDRYARSVLAEELRLTGHAVRVGEPEPGHRYDVVLVGREPPADACGPVVRLVDWDEMRPASPKAIDLDRPFEAVLGDIEAVARGEVLPGTPRETPWSEARARCRRQPAVSALARRMESVFGPPLGATDDGFRHRLWAHLTRLQDMRAETAERSG